MCVLLVAFSFSHHPFLFVLRFSASLSSSFFFSPLPFPFSFISLINTLLMYASHAPRFISAPFYYYITLLPIGLPPFSKLN